MWEADENPRVRLERQRHLDTFLPPVEILDDRDAAELMNAY